MKGARAAVELLQRQNVDVMFGIPGGVLLPFYDELVDSDIRHILVRHEQCAAHMADGFARASGRVGVAIATSGPGATNLTTGIATAMLDSSPTVFITGQVSSKVLGSDAFQEVDVTGITLPITKHNYLVTRADEIAQVVREAFYIARSGRPGPVLVDICKNAQIEKTEFVYPENISLVGYHPPEHAPMSDLQQAAKLIAEAERPVRNREIIRTLHEIERLPDLVAP